MILQRNNRRDDIERLDARLEAFDLALHNGFRALGFPSAIGNVRRNRLLKIINVVDENSIEIVHFRRYIARHRNIDEEHGAILAPAKKEFSMYAPENRKRRAGRRNDSIISIAGVIELLE